MSKYAYCVACGNFAKKNDNSVTDGVEWLLEYAEFMSKEGILEALKNPINCGCTEPPELIKEVLTFAEASKKWGLADSTLRKLVTTDKLEEGIDYRKSGSTWLITKEAMIRIYGEPNNV